MSTRFLNNQKEIPDFPEAKEIAEDWNMGSDAYRALSQFVEAGEVEFAEFGDAGNADPDCPFLETRCGEIEILFDFSIGPHKFFVVKIGKNYIESLSMVSVKEIIDGFGGSEPKGRVGA